MRRRAAGPVSANKSSACVSRTIERSVCPTRARASGCRSSICINNRIRVAGPSRRTHASKSSTHATRSASD